MNPKVSVVLPTLNREKFLDERIRSVLEQSLDEWELIVNDSYSEDSSWEIIQGFAAQDSRISAFQSPRDGLYRNWNRCIERARGEYIYIATSDDTMKPDCLLRLLTALEAHPRCKIASSALDFIDEDGKRLKNEWERLRVQLFLGPWARRPHIRLRPLELILNIMLGNVIRSLTQVLIHREVFDRIGLFPNDMGVGGDYFWGIRASAEFETLFVPEYLSSFRRHGAQATSFSQTDMAKEFAEVMDHVERRIVPELESEFPLLWEYLVTNDFVRKRKELELVLYRYRQRAFVGRMCLLCGLFVRWQMLPLFCMLKFWSRHDLGSRIPEAERVLRQFYGTLDELIIPVELNLDR